MTQGKYAWRELLSDLYSSRKIRVSIFFGLCTYIFLVKSGSGPLFSLLILVPCSYLAALIFFFVLETMILPLYRWLARENR